MSCILSITKDPFMLSVIMLNVIVPSVVMLNVMAPYFEHQPSKKYCSYAYQYNAYKLSVQFQNKTVTIEQCVLGTDVGKQLS
jgi:hypothetical protein